MILVFLLLAASTSSNGAVPLNKVKRSSVLPEWPTDFKWSPSGRPAGYDCVQITEPAEPSQHTWKDNFFCWRQGTGNPGIQWYYGGPIQGMRCTQILEVADPHTWSDNYLCVPQDSPYQLTWRSAGPVDSLSCIRWYEGADPHTWADNFLCAPPTAPYLPDPVFPADFRWSYAYVPTGYDCIRIYEPADPHTWTDNYFCWKQGTANPGLRWQYAGPIPGMRCTQILEPADPHTWADNYLCVPPSSSLRFTWSYAGPLRDHECLQWLEPADPHTWQDNYLCKERCQLIEVKVLDDNQLRGEKTGTQVIGSAFAGSCLATAGENNLSLMSLKGVKETMEIGFSDQDINWETSKTVKFTSTAKLFRSYPGTLTLDLKEGGTNELSQYSSYWLKEFPGIGHETYYLSPGAALILGLVDKYVVDNPSAPVTMYFRCSSGAKLQKDTKIAVKSRMFHRTRFESMIGKYHSEVCQRDNSVAECMPEDLAYSGNNYFGDVTAIRHSFKGCFEAGNGVIF